MKLALKTGVAGAYCLQVLDAEGRTKFVTDWFSNLIVDRGLDWLADTPGQGNAFVTTGTTPPSPSDTNVSGTILGYSSTIAANVWSSQIATLPNYASRKLTYSFGYGAIIGTISEVAIGSGSLLGVTKLFSRALIANSEGTPISITLTETDQLQLVYEYRHYMPDGDTTFNLTVNDVDTTFVVRPYRTNAEQYWSAQRTSTLSFFWAGSDSRVFASPTVLAGRTGSLSGNSYSDSNGAMLTYVPGSFSLDFYLEWLPSKGAIDATVFLLEAYPTAAGSWQISASPAISKTDLQTLRVEGTLSWGRYGESS